MVWNFLLSIYELDWDKLAVNKNKKYFCQCVFSQFNKKSIINSIQRKENKGKGKPVDISRIPLLIPSRPNKSILARSKFYKGNQTSKSKSYTQTSKENINKFIKIKDVFPKLNMMTKDFSYK